MGKDVAAKVGARLGKSLLELGGNNAVIITPDANLDIALRAAVFGAIGTCGQRCTSTRRLIVHKDLYETVKERLVKAYGQVRIGDPLDANNHMGPLIDTDAVDQYLNALSAAKEQGGKALIEGGKLEGKGFESGCYVKPAIVEIDHSADIVQNEVRQGLSSSIISNNLQEAETFLSHWGSDCGIANVNIGTSGAEIGGAFGGEKETGGGRESGSDAWKIYMRRQTNTINFSSDLPLAQGIKFDF
jgi:aldehyde dehydrogenase (NAD+)